MEDQGKIAENPPLLRASSIPPNHLRPLSLRHLSVVGHVGISLQYGRFCNRSKNVKQLMQRGFKKNPGKGLTIAVSDSQMTVATTCGIYLSSMRLELSREKKGGGGGGGVSCADEWVNLCDSSAQSQHYL